MKLSFFAPPELY
jgi:hypothetical protein